MTWAISEVHAIAAYVYRKDNVMLKKILPAVMAAALAALCLPSRADAYGATGYRATTVGPNGVSRSAGVAVSGPNGVAVAGARTTTGTNGATYSSVHGAAAGYGGYQYAPSYYGGAAAGYGYVR